jgi:hypothetical protein
VRSSLTLSLSLISSFSVIERERERLINLSRIFFYSNRTTHMREKKRNPKKRHLSLSLSPLSQFTLSRFSSSFYLRVPTFAEKRARVVSLSLSLSSSIYYISFILLWISNLIGRSFFKNLKEGNFFSKNLTTLLNRSARVYTSHIAYTRSSGSSSREGRCSISSSLCVCVFIYTERELFF